MDTAAEAQRKTGVRIGNGWVQAFFEGRPIAGMTFQQAAQSKDKGRRWIYAAIAGRWGQQVADLVVAGGVVVE